MDAKINFADRLVGKITKTNSRVCVGLDPRLELIPKSFQGDILKFNKAVIDIVKDIAVCVKPQIAFYEIFGPKGIEIFFETCEYASENGLIVIADIKRSDIADTALYYAKAYLTKNYIDAITLNPFFGSDSLKPFVDVAGENQKGLFVLVKTSNKSSEEIQDKVLDTLITIVHQFSVTLKGDKYSSLGIVVGATHPQQSTEIRKKYRQGFFLVPGYGFQGGNADSVKNCFNEDKFGAIINASRSLTFPKNQNWEKGVGEACLKMKNEINSILCV